MTEKISIVITVLNEEKTIERLLTALETQTFSPDEVIIVDGGSTDKTLQLLKAAAKNNRLIKIIEKAGNRSVGRNAGITLAKHDVIAITDAGCIPHHDWLEELAKCYRSARTKTDKKIVVAGYYDAQTSSPFTEAVVPYVLVMPDRVDPQHFLPATRSMLFEKTAWTAVGKFDESLSDNEDYAFALKLRNLPSIFLTFTDQAKVTWLPRTTLRSFWYMIFRFARGDVKAGIVRPKVMGIFARYIVMTLLSIYLLLISPVLLIPVAVFLLALYCGWAVSKNKKYAPHGWYWLPILQIVSDVAVMAGSTAGLLSR